MIWLLLTSYGGSVCLSLYICFFVKKVIDYAVRGQFANYVAISNEWFYLLLILIQVFYNNQFCLRVDSFNNVLNISMHSCLCGSLGEGFF